MASLPLLPARAPRIRALLVLVGTLALLLPAPVQAQSACEARYRVLGSNSWMTLSLNAGGVWNGTVNNLREIENVGRNDLMVRTSGIAGAIANNRLVRGPGGGTLVFPPAVWNGLQLQRVSCLAYATVYDAQDHLAAFGADAAALVADVTSVAQAAIDQARAQALELFGPAEEGLAELRALDVANTQEAWETFLSGAGAMAALPAATIQEHFPELHQAMVATEGYAFDLPTATVELWRSHAQGARASLEALDARLGVSAAAAEIMAIDPADAFPELHALQGASCTLDPAPWNRLQARYVEAEQAFGAFVEAAADLWPSDIADPLLRDLAGVVQRLGAGPCDADLASLARSLAADRQALQRFLAEAQEAIRGVDVRALTAGQAEFGRGLSALGTSTGELLRLLLEQERLEADVGFRAEEVDQARTRLVGEDAGGSPRAWLSRDYWERRARQGDPAQLEADAQALVTATERYEGAVRAREAGWNEVGRQWTQWQRDAGALSGLVPRLGVRVRGVDDLLRALASPPALRTPPRALSEASACLQEGVRRLVAEVEALRQITGRLLDAVVAAFRVPTLSPELQAQLERAREARNAADRAGAQALADFVRMGGHAQRVTTRLVHLAAMIQQDPADDHYVTRLDASLADVRDEALALAEARLAYQGSVEAHGRAEADFRREVSRLAGLVLPDSPWAPAMAALQGTMRGLEADGRAVAAGTASALACTGDLVRLVDAAATTFPQRAQAYLGAVGTIVGSAVVALVPERVRQATDEALAASADLVGAWGGVLTRTNAVGAAASTFLLASSDLALSQPRSLEEHLVRITAAHTAATALWESSTQLLEARGLLAQPQARFQSSLADLAEAFHTSGMEGVNEGAHLAWSAVDLDLLSGEFDKAQFVAERWGAAAGTFPQRMLAFAGSSLPPAMQNQMNVLMNTLAQRGSELNTCLSQGLSARAATQAAAFRSGALTSVMSGFETLATSVLAGLDSLVPPTLDIFAQAAGILNDAATLQARIQGMPTSAASSFQAVAAEALGNASTASQCVQTRSNQIAALSSQAMAIMNADH